MRCFPIWLRKLENVKTRCSWSSSLSWRLLRLMMKLDDSCHCTPPHICIMISKASEQQLLSMSPVHQPPLKDWFKDSVLILVLNL